MSSEGSISTTSSGIRQFGLYRTIDARTEEFLRLSRKRQIRQGCACAAISTAITVTVVISIALIYEYSIFESNSKTELKPNWLSLMNKSEDAISFDAKLNKAKINLDPMYVQFLPLILKTLKKNKYFDQILEEDSSQTPVYERRETQEDTYTQNIFSDTRNWIRMPSSRLYAIEYKTSPIVYFKNPTRNIDHFTKIRRIRDYQRIMNYVDKMISERVTYGSTVPMLKNTYNFHRKFPIITYTTPITKVMEHVTKKVEPMNRKYSNRMLSTADKKNCRCPKKMSELLSKLIKSLQKLIPDFVNSEQKTPNPCDESHLKTIEPVKNTMDQGISKNPLQILTQNHRSNYKFSKISTDKNTRNLFTSTENSPTPEFVPESLEMFNIQSTPINKTILNPNTLSKTYSLKPLPSKINYSLSSIIRLLKPSLDQNVHKCIRDDKTNTFTTTINQFMEATDSNYDLQEITMKPMTKFTSTTKAAPIIVTTVEDFILKRNDRNTTKSILTLPIFSDDQYEDYNVDTTTDVAKSFKILNAHSTELVKNKLLASSNERKNTKDVTHFKINDDLTNNYVDYIREDQNMDKTLNILKKMGTLAFTTTESIYDINWRFNNSTTVTSLKEKIDDLDIEANSNQKLKENKQEQQSKIEDITLEEEVDKAFNEDMIPEYNMKNIENSINKLNYSDITNKTLSKDSSEVYKWEQIENDDIKDQDSKMSRSMIPESRPSYLEIQRNDWKPDDNQDYDNNINNYVFE